MLDRGVDYAVDVAAAYTQRWEVEPTLDELETQQPVDAMHTQADTASLITGAGADDVLTVKSNQPRLYAALKKLSWSDVPARSP